MANSRARSTRQLASEQRGEEPVLIGLTFKARDGNYCRSFVLRATRTAGPGVPRRLGLAGAGHGFIGAAARNAAGELGVDAGDPAGDRSARCGAALDAEAREAARN